jgi:hypothetical protein
MKWINRGAHFAKVIINVRKMFMKLTTGVNRIKTFFFVVEIVRK